MDPAAPDRTAEHSLADRLLAEGVSESLIAAAHEAGLRGGARPHPRTLLRAALSRKLEALKLPTGKWTTSPAAIVRWIVRQQRRRHTQAAPARAADPQPVLERYGLGRRDQEAE